MRYRMRTERISLTKFDQQATIRPENNPTPHLWSAEPLPWIEEDSSVGC